MLRFFISIFIFLLFFFQATTTTWAVTPTNLLSEDLYDWYNAIVAITPNVDRSGAWVMEPLGDKLYFGLSSDVPEHDHDGPVLGYFDGTNLNNIAEMTQQDIIRLFAYDGLLYAPDYDPDSGWDASELYIYDPDEDTLTQKRYRYSSWQFVDATTSDENGSYSFTGLKPTSYRIRAVRPADYDFSPQFVESQGNHMLKDSNGDTSGYDVTCTQLGSAHSGIRFMSDYTDYTEDFGFTPSPGTSAGSPTSGTRNEIFYTGQFNIGDLVWEDTNGNGIQDDNESGLAGVRIELYTKDPYFPCSPHSAGFWIDPNTNYWYLNQASQALASNGWTVFTNVTMRSADGGENWEFIYEPDLQSNNYFAYDLYGYNNYLYQIDNFNTYNFNIDEEGFITYDTYPTNHLPYVSLGQNNADWSEHSFYSSTGLTITTDYRPIFNMVNRTSKFPLHIYDKLVGFLGGVVRFTTDGSQVYRFNGSGYDVINITGASFGDILPEHNDPDFSGDEINGVSQRYNSLDTTSDGKYLYALGDDNKVYATTNLRNWIEVADFTSVGGGKRIIAIKYWPNQDQVVVSTIGDGGSLYGLSHTDIVNQHFTKIQNSNFSIVDELEPDVDLTTIGGTGTQNVILKKNDFLVGQVEATLSGNLLDWTSVNGDTNQDQGKSVVTKLTEAPGTASTHTLFIPIPSRYSDSLSVHICPLAETLEQVSQDCEDGFVLTAEESITYQEHTITANKMVNEGQDYWQVSGLTGTGGFAIPYPTPSDEDIVSESDIVSAPGCGDQTPWGTPDLFQITRSDTSATLYFTPVGGNVSGYHVIYGYNQFDSRFGSLSQTITNAHQGVQHLVINDLEPYANYSFKIAPVNGCAVGSWSNWLNTEYINSNKSYFYRYSNLGQE